jgi:hypothetical protein
MRPKVTQFITYHKLLPDMSRILLLKWTVRQNGFSNMKTYQVSQEEATPAEKAGQRQG